MNLQLDPSLGLPGCTKHQPADKAQVDRTERALAVSGVVRPANLLQQMGN